MARVSAAQRRDDLVNAAVEVIATHGIDGATTRRIAEQANANLAMLHYCYDSKEDLFADVYAFVGGRFREVVMASGPRATVEETARHLLRVAMETYLESPSFAAATVELLSWARRQHGDRGIAVYDQAFAAVRDLIRASATNRPLAPETIDEIGFVIASLADGFALNWITYGDTSVARRQMEIADSVLASWLGVRLGSPALAG